MYSNRLNNMSLIKQFLNYVQHNTRYYSFDATTFIHFYYYCMIKRVECLTMEN